jgi:signal transduction histidine kinase
MSNLRGMAYRCKYDRDRTLEFASHGCLDLTGYAAADFIRNKKVSFGELIHPEDRDKVWDDVQSAVREKRPFLLTFRITTATGNEKWVWEQGIGIFSSEGTVEALEGFICDTTASKRDADALGAHAQRLRSLSHRLLHVQETERHHIARELHDQVGQLLTGLKLNLEMLQHGNADFAGATLAGALNLINELTTRMRSLSLDLRPSMLDDLGLLPALLWHFDNYTKQTHVRVGFRHDGLDRRMAPDIETAAYRIVQEALTNVARHAVVDEAEVRCSASQTQLHIQVEDHGKGFDSEAELHSHTTSGLSGMRERAALLGGHLTVDSTPGQGTRVIAEIPLSSEVNHEQ